MYLPMVVALMLVLPLISIVAQLMLADHSALAALSNLAIVAKWYVFWAVGVRLSLAGLRQIFQPRYTAETILGFTGAESLFFVRELGFANISMGSIGALSLLVPSLREGGSAAGCSLLWTRGHQSLLSQGPQQVAKRRPRERSVRRSGARYLLFRLTRMVTLSDSASKTILASPLLS
jgi:hypothetical protein